MSAPMHAMNVVANQVAYEMRKNKAHPNEFDRRRIMRELAARKRYRYVDPTVHDAQDGYRIESPCCSRNIDPQGGVVDVALLRYVENSQPWRLYRKDHRMQQWLLHSVYERLADLLEQLNADPQRVFWQ